jgi:hypothetical protein
MRDRGATRVIRGLAERQHGVVARRQLVEAGVGDWLAAGRTEAGLLVPLFRGIFAVGHRRVGQKGRWMAAVLACGPGAALSHASAMELWGLRRSRGPVEVLRRSGGQRSPRPDIRLHQTRRLPQDDIHFEDGIPVTTVERALLDMAGRLNARQLERVLAVADRSELLRWDVLRRKVERGRGRRGIARLRRVAAAMDPRAADALSPLEVDFLALCREHSLPIPQVNVLVEGCLVDFLWPGQRLVVETDGYTYHRDRAAFERDHERTVRLTAAGYEVHRATRLMLHRDPAPFLQLVRRQLRARRRMTRTASTSWASGPRS